MGISYDRFAPVLVQAVQELNAKIEALEAKLETQPYLKAVGE